MCFAGSVLWTLTSESFFICHCLIPWHYDYCNFICDKTLQKVRLYVRNSCPQRSAPRDRSVMGFIMFTHTLSSSAFPCSSWLRVLFAFLPLSFGLWGGGQCLFFISRFNLGYETLLSGRWCFEKAWMLREAVNRICALTSTIEKFPAF